MNTNKKTTKMDMKAKLSTLWIFVLFNIIFAEFHKLLQPGFLEAYNSPGLISKARS